jgi:hypothetical protein
VGGRDEVVSKVVVCLATGTSWKKMTLALNLISAVTCRA